jgi:hypothetical protein
MTFATRLAGRRKRVGFFVHIHGVPRIWKTHAGIDASAILGSTYAESTGISADLFSLGQESIDREKRCVTGGGLDFRIVEKHGSTVVRDIVQPRKRKITHLATSIGVADTTLVFGTNTVLTNGQVIYLGHETIIVGTKSGGATATGCTRAAYGSRAQTHKAATSLDGTAVYDVPPAWKGRRVTLWMCFLDDNDACDSAGLASKVGTYSLSGAPQLQGKRAWAFSALPLSSEYAKKKLYVGLKKVDQEGLELVPASGDQHYTLSPVQNTQLFTPGANWTSYAIAELEWGDEDAGAVLLAIEAATTVTDTLDVFVERAMIRPEVPEIVRRKVKSLTPIVFAGSFGGAAGLLIFLTSNQGDLANGTWDRLPGLARSEMNSTGFRFGANIDEDDIDEASFEITPRTWQFPLMKSTDVGTILADWALAADAWWLIDEDGRIAATPARVVAGASVGTIDESMIAAPDSVKVSAEETAVYPTVKFKANFSPLSDRFLYDGTVHDFEIEQRYPQSDDVLEIESRGIGIEGVPVELPYHLVRPTPGTLTLPELESWLRAVQLSYGRVPCVVQVTCRLSALAFRIGDVVTFNAAGYVDYEGGNLEGRSMRVIARRPRIKDALVDFELELVDQVFRVAPSAVIASGPTTVSIANDTLTLSTTSADASGANPENDFDVAGLSVRLWDVSLGTSQVLVVAEKLSGNRLRFTTGVVGTPEAGRDWLTWNTLGVNTAAAATTSGYQEEDFLYQMPDDPTAPSAGEVRRWR